MKKILTTAILGLAVTTAFSQINWRKGGNAQVPPFAPSSIGTDASWNAPFEIMTNGIQSFATYTVQHRIKTLPKTSTLAH